MLLVSLTLFFVSCTTTSEKLVPDPRELRVDGYRDQGNRGRGNLLSNRIFSARPPVNNQSLKIPINPVCSNQYIETNRENLSLLIFPTDKRNWKEPIVFRDFSSTFLDHSIAKGFVDLDLTSIPDGEYLFAFCRNESLCKTHLRRRLAAIALKNKELMSNGDNHLIENKLYNKVIENTFGSTVGLVGFATNVWLSRGSIVWPQFPQTIENGFVHKYFESKYWPMLWDDKAISPVFHIAYSGQRVGLESGQCYKSITPWFIDIGNSDLKMSSFSYGTKFKATNESFSWPKNSNVFAIITDLNLNGKFDGILDLPTGFSTNSLIALDDNKDKFLNEDDSNFEKIKLWQDINRNGKSESNELFPLRSKNIESIDLRFISIEESDFFGNYSNRRSIVKIKKSKIRMLFNLRLVGRPD